MRQIVCGFGGMVLALAAGLVGPASAQAPPAQTSEKPAAMKAVPGILPTGFGDEVDRDIERARKATARFKIAEAAVSAGYPANIHCVQNQPAGAMGLHYQNNALLDTTLDVEKPEVLVYETLADGRVRLNGVEYLVPIAEWKRDEPPMILGQKLKKAPSLGIWYLHAWIWTASPSGIFSDWNPDVKCRT